MSQYNNRGRVQPPEFSKAQAAGSSGGFSLARCEPNKIRQDLIAKIE
jgi:hypothetical protein